MGWLFWLVRLVVLSPMDLLNFSSFLLLMILIQQRLPLEDETKWLWPAGAAELRKLFLQVGRPRLWRYVKTTNKYLRIKKKKVQTVLFNLLRHLVGSFSLMSSQWLRPQPVSSASWLVKRPDCHWCWSLFGGFIALGETSVRAAGFNKAGFVQIQVCKHSWSR